MRKKLLSWFLTVTMMLSLFVAMPMTANAQSAEVWNGSAEVFLPLDPEENNSADNPYIIDTAAKLARLAQEVNAGNSYSGAYFKLTKNLDLGEIAWNPIGFDDSKSFNGIFDGDGHLISGLNVNQTASGKNAYAGLFGWLSGNGIIKNLQVSGNVSQQITYYASGAVAGGIVGLVYAGYGGDSPIIDNCSFSGNVTGTGIMSISNNSIAGSVGGIVGLLLNNATVRNCSYTSGNVVATTTYTSGNAYARAGGIAGLARDAKIINSYNISAGTVSANDANHVEVGGIVGITVTEGNPGMIASCYNTATLSASSGTPGGIAGTLSNDTIVSSVYWNDACGTAVTAGNMVGDSGKMTVAEMQTTSFRDTLNSNLNTLADSSLYLWQQTERSFPVLSDNVAAYVAQVGSIGYPTLADALANAGGSTIRLLADINYSSAIKADTQNVTIDLNGFDLAVSGVTEHALQATNGRLISIIDQDEEGGKISVSSSGPNKYAAYAAAGGDINIEGTLTATYPGGLDNQGIIGAYATDAGSTIQVTGSVSGYSEGIHAVNSAHITVDGTVNGTYYGAYIAYRGSAAITGYVSGSRALVVEYAGTAEVDGDITGSNWAVEGATDFGWDPPVIRVTGDVTGSGGAAISASNAADIQITGDVTGYTAVSGSSSACPDVTINGDITVSTGFGVSVFYGGTVTVNGRIIGASPYLKLNNLDISQDDFEISGNYFKYSNLTAETPAPFAANTVYVAMPVTHTVTIGTLSGGTITANPTSAAPGTTINLTITPDSGKRLKAGTLKYNDGTDHAITGTNFIMPGSGVTVTAVFENIPSSGGGSYTPLKYPVTESNQGTQVGGQTKLSKELAEVGDTVIITVITDKGYVSDKPVVLDRKKIPLAVTDNGDGTFSFRMPSGGVMVDVDFSRIDYFDDVNGNDWFDEASWFCAAHGLMQGTGNRQFDGHMGTNRAMLVTVLYRLANSTDSLESIFDDVESGKWYSDAIGWAAHNKIVGGYGNGKFGPDDALTREQMVSVLYRYSIFMKYGVSKQSDLDTFTDADAISEWALEAMKWAVRNGIVEGVGNDLVSPGTGATRAQFAAMMQRYATTFVK